MSTWWKSLTDLQKIQLILRAIAAGALLILLFIAFFWKIDKNDPESFLSSLHEHFFWLCFVLTGLWLFTFDPWVAGKIGTHITSLRKVFGIAAAVVAGVAFGTWALHHIEDWLREPTKCSHMLSVSEGRCDNVTDDLGTMWLKIDDNEGDADNNLLVWRSDGSVQEPRDYKLVGRTSWYRFRAPPGQTMDICFVLSATKPKLSC